MKEERRKRIDLLISDGYSLECSEKMVEYYEMFGDYLPAIERFMPNNEEYIIEVIDRCLKEKKDVYQLKILDVNELFD